MFSYLGKTKKISICVGMCDHDSEYRLDQFQQTVTQESKFLNTYGKSPFEEFQ